MLSIADIFLKIINLLFVIIAFDSDFSSKKRIK